MKKILIVGVEVLIIFISVFFAERDIKENVYSNTETVKESIIGEITKDKSIVQKFTTEKEVIDALLIKTATFDRVNKGNITFTIKSGDEVLGEKSLDMSKLKNNLDTRIEFDEPLIIKEKELELVIETDDDAIDGNAITLYACNEAPKDNKLSIDGVIQEGSLKMKVVSVEWSLLRCIYLFVTTSLLYVYLLFMLKTIKQK